MNKFFIFIIAAVLAIIVYMPDLKAQNDDWYVSAANYARYYHFKETKLDSAATRFQFDVYMGKFYTGAWYEVAHVMSDGFGNYTSNSLSQRYFGWEENGLTIHAGNFYQVFDRGLILNTFRDDEAGADLVLDGIQINWRKKYLDIDLLSATPGIGDLPFGAKEMIRGGRFKLKPVNQFHLGGAYVSYITDTRTNLNQVNARINIDYLDGYVEYAKRNYQVPDPNDFTRKVNKTGDGTYGLITGYYSYFTGFFEYKNYKFLAYPEIGILNIPPAVNRQDRLLQSEAANYFMPITGERGYRGNLSISWSDFWGFETDYAKTYSRDSISVYLYEYYFGIRGNYSEDNTFHTSLDLLEFSKRDETKSEFEIEYQLTDYASIDLNAYMIIFEPIDSSEYTEKYLDITYTVAPNFRLSVGGSISDNDFSDSPKRKMAYIQVNYAYGNHDLTIFYGGERGGLVCSGGLCTYHPAFEGLKAELFSRF